MTATPETPKALSAEELEEVVRYLNGDHAFISRLRDKGIIFNQSLQELHSRIAATIATQAAEIASARNDALEEVTAMLTKKCSAAFAKGIKHQNAGHLDASSAEAIRVDELSEALSDIARLKAPPIPAEGAK